MTLIKWGDSRLPERFWIKTVINEATGCWEWTAGTDDDGYGIFRFPGLTVRRAHRGAYLTLVGPIEEETLNHDCHIRRCVNVNKGHAATPMSSVDNVREGKARIEECPQGHAYTSKNTMMVGPRKTSRACRRCYNDRSSKYWRNTRSAAEKEARRKAGYRGNFDETQTCKRNHPRTEGNTYTTPSGYRTCAVCRRENAEAFRLRQATKRG
jgi:hypothetical protein